MAMGSAGSDTGLIDATATATASGVTALTPSLPGGSVGTPVLLEVASSVAATLTLNISNNQQLVLIVTPNQPPMRRAIPANAFPSKVSQVSASANLSAAGNLYVRVGFRP